MLKRKATSAPLGASAPSASRPGGNPNHMISVTAFEPGEVADAIGQPQAVRAVGTANGANPLSLVVPCHRVVRAGGKLGGYGGGLPLKKRLLAMEHQRPLAGDLL